jgi:hypothetical protein
MQTLFAPLADLYPAEVPARLVAYDPRLSSRQVEAQVGWKKNRLQRRQFWLDEDGLGTTTLHFAKPGLYPVRLVTAGKGTLSQSQVMVGSRHPAPLGVVLDYCQFHPNDGTVDLGLEIFFNRHRYRGELELDLRSPFKTIHVKKVDVEDGCVKTTLRFRAEWPLFLVLRGPHTGQQTFLALPEGQVEEEEEVRLDVAEEVKRGEGLRVSVAAGELGQRGLLLITDARCPLALLGRSASGQAQPPSKGIQKEIDLRLQNGKLPGAIHRGATHVPVCEVVPLRSFERTFRLPDLLSVPQWQVRLLVPNCGEFRQVLKPVSVKRPEGISLDIPRHLGPDDEVEGIVTYDTSDQPAKLIVENGSKTQQDLRPNDQGEVGVWLKGAPDARLKVRLLPEEGDEKIQEWQNNPPVVQPTLHTRFAEQGEGFEGGVVRTLYPGPEALLVQVAQSLVEYPHGCAEQTSSKLGGLAVVWRIAQEGIEVPYQDELDQYIEAGLKRMKSFEKQPGQFSFWQDGTPNMRVTGMVYRNLLPFQKLEIPRADKLLRRTEKALDREGDLVDVRKNRQEGLGWNILKASGCYADPEASERERERALRYVCDTAVLRNGELRWPEGTPWGGAEYSTCLALRTLRQAGVEELRPQVNPPASFSPLRMRWWEQLLMNWHLYHPEGTPFRKKVKRRRVEKPFWAGLNHLVGDMPAGRFYSPPATREYVELLADMHRDWEPSMIRFLDQPEQEMPVDQALDTQGRPFEVVSERALVTWEDHPSSAPESDRQIKVMVKGPDHKVSLEETFPVEVSYAPKVEHLTMPVLCLHLPPHLHFFTGGLSMLDSLRYWEIPFQEERTLKLDLCAVRRGRGPIDFQVLDMYDRGINGVTREFVEVR